MTAMESIRVFHVSEYGTAPILDHKLHDSNNRAHIDWIAHKA